MTTKYKPCPSNLTTWWVRTMDLKMEYQENVAICTTICNLNQSVWNLTQWVSVIARLFIQSFPCNLCFLLWHIENSLKIQYYFISETDTIQFTDYELRRICTPLYAPRIVLCTQKLNLTWSSWFLSLSCLSVNRNGIILYDLLWFSVYWIDLPSKMRQAAKELTPNDWYWTLRH